MVGYRARPGAQCGFVAQHCKKASINSIVNPDIPAAAQFQVCRAIANDLEATSRLFATVIQPLEYYSEAARRSEIAKYSVAELERSIAGDPDSVLIAKAGGAVVAFCMSEHDHGVLWLAWFGTSPPWRNRGVVQALVAALEGTLNHRGAHKIWCDSRTDNEPSKRLLTKLGFAQITTVVNHWYGHDYILWEKTLV